MGGGQTVSQRLPRLREPAGHVPVLPARREPVLRGRAGGQRGAERRRHQGVRQEDPDRSRDRREGGHPSRGAVCV